MNDRGDTIIMPYVNMQPAVPQAPFTGTYQVHSIFHTVQGEGPFSGEAAVFIRLQDCNLQCPFCDTDYTSQDRASVDTARQITGKVGALIGDHETALIVITGGEPFRQDIYELVETLREADYCVQIETNGTMKPSEQFKTFFEERPGVHIVVSPKASFVDPWIAEHAMCFKYVLSHDSIDPADGLPLIVLGRKSNRVARPPFPDALKYPIYISPADMGDDTEATKLNHEAVVRSCQKYCYRLQLQIHKYLGVE